MNQRDEEKFDLILDRISEDALLDMIEQYPSPHELTGKHTFSAEHEKKMQQIIKDARKRESQKTAKRKSRLLRFGVNIAAAFGILCFLATLMAFTVPTARVALQNYLMTEKDGFIEIEVRGEEKEFENEVYNFPSYIPAGFRLENAEESENFLMAFYVNESDKVIRIQRLAKGASIMVDTEDARHKEIDINGKKGEFVAKNGGITIVFNNSEYAFIVSTDISEEEIMKVVRSISQKK